MLSICIDLDKTFFPCRNRNFENNLKLVKFIRLNHYCKINIVIVFHFPKCDEAILYHLILNVNYSIKNLYTLLEIDGRGSDIG